MTPLALKEELEARVAFPFLEVAVQEIGFGFAEIRVDAPSVTLKKRFDLSSLDHFTPDLREKALVELAKVFDMAFLKATGQEERFTAEEVAYALEAGLKGDFNE